MTFLEQISEEEKHLGTLTESKNYESNPRSVDKDKSSIISLVPSSQNPTGEERLSPAFSLIKNPFVSLYSKRIQQFSDNNGPAAKPEIKSRNARITNENMRAETMIQSSLAMSHTNTKLHTPDSSPIKSARTPKLKKQGYLKQTISAERKQVRGLNGNKIERSKV